MPIFRILLLAFIVVPLIEIALFIVVGREIGLWWTLGIVVLTAVTGAALAKREGAAAWKRFHQALGQGRLPGVELADGALILLAGALLLTPGFFTDVVGFSLLLPVSRGWLRQRLLALLEKRLGQGLVWRLSFGPGNDRPPGPAPVQDDPEIIEAEAELVDDDPPARRP